MVMVMVTSMTKMILLVSLSENEWNFCFIAPQSYKLFAIIVIFVTNEKD